MTATTAVRDRREWALVAIALLGAWLVGFTLLVRGVEPLVADDLLVGLASVATAGYNYWRTANREAPLLGLARLGAGAGLWLVAFSFQYGLESPLLWNSVAVGTLLTVANALYYRAHRSRE